MVVAFSPIILYFLFWRKVYSSNAVNAPEEGRKTHECHDYARGYAQGLEDAAHHRRRGEEAEREVERLRSQLQDSQRPRPPAGEWHDAGARPQPSEDGQTP